MKIIAPVPVRNEGWCLALTLRALLMWVDEVVVGLHACTDESEAIVKEIGKEHHGRVWTFSFHGDTWTEMAHRQQLLEESRQRGATHIALVDADEVLTGDMLPSIRGIIESLPPGRMLSLPWLQLRNSIHRVHNTGMWGAPHMNVSAGFRDEAGLHWTSETRDGYDHHHREPMGRTWVQRELMGRNAGLMHLQFLSNRRLFAKQYLYQLTERLRWPGKHHGGAISGIATMVGMYRRTVVEHLNAPGIGAHVPGQWWAPYAHLMQYLDIDREPWQVAECRRLIRENHGIEVGLDNFGLEL